jgi:hypothetical protein
MSTFQPQRLDGSTTNVITVTSGTKLVGESPGAFYMEGMVIQVAYAQTPIGNTYTLNYTYDLCPIPDMFIDFKPIYSTSRIYITAMVNCNAPHVTSYGFFRDGINMQTQYLNQIKQPTLTVYGATTGSYGARPGFFNWQGANNNVHGSLHTTYPGEDRADLMWNAWLQFWDVDNRSNARRRYEVGVNASWGDSIRTLKINDRDTNDMRSICSLCVMEIA